LIYWDGRVDGQIVPAGVYYFVVQSLDCRGKSLIYRGNLSILY
jgi:hypothetical protein